jgi:hypothetical protein
MAMDFISMAAVGVLVFCILYALNHLSGKRLPKWLTPASIGVAMITYSIWNEYSWFDRVSSQLPDRVAVLDVGAAGAPWRPWSYVFPVISRFSALDTGAVLRSPGVPELVATDILLVQRWANTIRVPVAFDCKAAMRADLVGSAELAPDGTLTGATWVPVGQDDKMLQAACNGG